MKKFFIAFTVLAALTFSVSPVLAVPGVPDNQPGSDFTCFFSVSQARVADGAGPTTLYNLSDVGGLYNKIHLLFYTTKSVFVADAWFEITPWGTVMKDIASYLIAMSATDRTKLATTFMGADYYQGYIVAEGATGAKATTTSRSTSDNLIGTVYLLDMSSGLASAANIPMREVYTGTPTGARLAITNSATGSYEVWTPNALAAAQDLVWGKEVSAATWFSMYLKYYILNANAGTYFIIWANGFSGFAATPYYASFHLYVINGAEDYLSTTIQLYELTFLDASAVIPDGLKVAYPYLGLFNFTQPGQAGSPASVDTSAEMLAYAWQYANDGAASAATNWDVLTRIATDVGTTGDVPQPVH